MTNEEKRDVADHEFWKRVSELTGRRLVGWTWRQRATFEGLELPGDVAERIVALADLVAEKDAKIERLKEAMWAQHDRNVELSKAIERLRKALEQAIDYETPRDTSIADWWECYLVECENELMGSESNYSNMFDWPDELTDELRKRERVY